LQLAVSKHVGANLRVRPDRRPKAVGRKESWQFAVGKTKKRKSKKTYRLNVLVAKKKNEETPKTQKQKKLTALVSWWQNRKT
jgi:hypothetical protein